MAVTLVVRKRFLQCLHTGWRLALVVVQGVTVFNGGSLGVSGT